MIEISWLIGKILLSVFILGRAIGAFQGLLGQNELFFDVSDGLGMRIWQTILATSISIFMLYIIWFVM